MFLFRVQNLLKTIVNSTNRESTGERIRYVGTVPGVDRLRVDPAVKVIQGNGRTLMSGLGDAHTHLTWNGGALGIVPPSIGVGWSFILIEKQATWETWVWKSIH